MYHLADHQLLSLHVTSLSHVLSEQQTVCGFSVRCGNLVDPERKGIGIYIGLSRDSVHAVEA